MTEQTHKAGSDTKADNRRPLTISQAAEYLNTHVSGVVEAFGLRPFLLAYGSDPFQKMTEKVASEPYEWLYIPFGLQLTPIGYWNDIVRIQFEKNILDSKTRVPTAAIYWSSGGGAAEADLIIRASQACNALNLAFSEFERRFRIVREV